MKFLLLFLISFSVYGNYLSKTEMETCLGSRTVYMNKSSCESTKLEPCFRVPKNYNCNHYLVKSSKNEAETCADDAECQTILNGKVCSDSNENAIMVLDTDPKEVYCTKERGVSDSALKVVYDAAELVIQKEKDDDNQRRNQLRGLLNSLRSGTDLTPQQTRRLQIQVIKKLFGK